MEENKTVKIRWKVPKDIYYPGEVTEVARSFAQFAVHHGYAEFTEPLCPECLSHLVADSGCRTCLSCGWSKCG